MSIIDQTEVYVKGVLQGAESGHDWWHIYRVWQTSKTLAIEENANLIIVELSALLHDIADSKFNNGDEEIGPDKAGSFLRSINVEESIVNEVQKIIKNMSFKAGLGEVNYQSLELKVVQDADRLDAIGAIGIARAFSYGGFKGREFYNPDIQPNLNMTKEQYKMNKAPTINHFYEKLLKLKDTMNTRSGAHLAAHRHKFLEDYLEQFYKEWDGK